MMFTNHKSGFVLALLAAALCTACSQNNMVTSSLPSAGSGADSLHGKVIAPLAKHMLALRGSHPVIPAHVGIAGLFAPVRPDTGTTLYDSIVLYNGKTGDNLSSEGFECCQVDEFGDAVNLTQSDTATKVSVVMQSWACASGSWYAHNCSTPKPPTKFAEPITLSIYRVVLDTNMNPQPGTLLAQQTKTFMINYRPSANPRCVGSAYSAGGFIGKPDGYCDEGLSQTISWNVKRPVTSLPSQVIVTLAYNTSTSGYSPYGTNTPCYTSSGGCGYDGLNVSADGNGGPIGSPIDPNGVQVYYTNSSDYTNYGCTTYNPNYTVQDSSGCWAGYHPDIEVTGT
jgi:hypothetical protein